MAHHYHYLDPYRDSFAVISESQSCTTAIVFVHGFGGNAIDTWADLQLEIDNNQEIASKFNEADLYFYRYSSVVESVASSVNRLSTFLRDIAPSPLHSLFEIDLSPLHVADDDSEKPEHLTSVLPASRYYEQLILVGHSEGGVILRTLLVDLAKIDTPFAKACRNARVKLFAPAIFGYAPSGILGFVVNLPVLSDLIDAALRMSPAYRDLQPEKKKLKELQEKTETLAGEDIGIAYRASLLWGRLDRIVQDGKYDADSSDYRTGHGHSSICKPSRKYPDPATFIVAEPMS